MNEKIKAWFEGREDEFVNALAPLVAIDSTTGTPAPGAPFGEGPAKALKAALELAESWGLKTSEDDGYVGLVDLNDHEDQLHVLAHLDVVGIGDGWNTDPFTLVRDGDMIYGRGTDDDKGPALAAMMAMRCVKELGLPLTKNVKLVLGTDEETGSRDIEHYYAHAPFAPNSVTPDAEFPVINVEKARYAPEFSAAWEKVDVLPRLVSVKGGIRANVAPGHCTAVVAGVESDTVKAACAGVAERTGVEFLLSGDAQELTIQANGAEAHASTPDEGKNAITALLEVLCQLPLGDTPAFDAVKKLHKVFPFGDNSGKALGVAQQDEISGPLTLSFSVLHLDETGFQGQFDVRASVCANEENLVKVTEQTFADFGWTCEGELDAAHVVDPDSEFIHTLLDCYTEFSGEKGYCVAIGGGTYVHDIPGGVAFGAGEFGFDSHLHGANERARISRLLMTAQIYASVIARLCA